MCPGYLGFPGSCSRFHPETGQSVVVTVQRSGVLAQDGHLSVQCFGGRRRHRWKLEEGEIAVRGWLGGVGGGSSFLGVG